ncbi:glycerophosphodiester phosphodiesterase family protein [Sphingomonas sp. Leaf343]|uniref:glycerophosphodiester phosphodiesterase family protein n=1 Tax=Sphingomonas sp. Leaf343 TaxID=1736345 RepID=UPI0006F6F07E|nr:glycerophosphodiester phosphodiesterase family protein [Sphingomonas sp. Leaf343]KQR81363.1 hypothetical protein ASG07_13090 [Sphingomonas sp. Leaf343]
MNVRNLCIAFAIVTLAAPAVAENYSPAKVIQAMKVDNSRLRIVVEHRGHFSGGCPENSACAMAATADGGIEAAEIDIRESADGTLWPIHDTKIGRLTNYSANGHLFNPFYHSAQNDVNNPAIEAMRDATLRTLKLRDPSGVVTSSPFQPLEAMMHQVDVRNRNLVYVFDIKTKAAIGKVAAMIKRLGLDDRSVLKFNSTLTSVSEVSAETQGLHFVPVLGTGSLDQIADHHHLEKSQPSERIAAYVSDWAHTGGFVYFEVRNKMFSGPSSGNTFDAKVEGPLSELDFYMALSRIAIGGYAPHTEHYSTADQPGTGYYFVDGQCCQQLGGTLDRSRAFGPDLRDDRENLHYMISYNAVTISDQAASALNVARAMGGRADQYKLYY